MAIFNSFLLVYQRVDHPRKHLFFITAPSHGTRRFPCRWPPESGKPLSADAMLMPKRAWGIVHASSFLSIHSLGLQVSPKMQNVVASFIDVPGWFTKKMGTAKQGTQKIIQKLWFLMGKPMVPDGSPWFPISDTPQIHPLTRNLWSLPRCSWTLRHRPPQQSCKKRCRGWGPHRAAWTITEIPKSNQLEIQRDHLRNVTKCDEG